MAKITCTNCQTVSDLPDEYLGRSVACKVCQTVFTATAIGGAAKPRTAINAGAAKPSQVKTVLGSDPAGAGGKLAPGGTMLGSAAKTGVAKPSQIKTVLGPAATAGSSQPVATAPPAPATEARVLTVMARRVGAKGARGKDRQTARGKEVPRGGDEPAEAASSFGRTAILIGASALALLLPIAAAGIFAVAMWGRAWPAR